MATMLLGVSEPHYEQDRLFQFLVNVQPERRQVMAHPFGFLPPLWEIQTKSWALEGST